MPSATYWRISVVNSTYTVLAIAEIKFFDGTSTQIPTTGGTASTDDGSNGAASNAFDGNAATFWATGGPATPSAPHWIQYHFASAVTPVTYSITNRATNFQNPDSWSLQYSNDGTTWTTVGNYSAAWTSAGQTQTFNVSGNGLGTAYRILITANGGGAVVALSEMSFKDGSGATISLTGGASSASSIYSGDFNDGSADAFDGNTATYWAAGSASSSGSPEWLAYRFSGAITPASFTVTARNDSQYSQSPATFKLQKSTDGVTWTDVQSFTAAAWTSAGQVQTFTITAASPHQRGNIDYDQIRYPARQGLGAQFQMFGGGAVTPGHLAAYDSNGNVIDGGAPSSAGAVSSVFGRTGAVVAVSGDYTAAMVTNAVDSTQTYANPSWITSLAYSKITGAPAAYVLPPATASVLGGVKIGANITVLADGTISVAAPPTIPVSSVFGRTGAVVAASGDYTAAQVTNAVDSTQTYANPAWITSLAWSKITGAPTIYVDPLTTTGDMLYRSSSASTRLGIGTAGQVLTVVSGLPAWATPASAPVSSVFTRTGAVVAQSGDYTAAQVTNAVDSTQSYANPSWITSLAWSKITGAPAIYVDPLTTTGDLLYRSSSATTRLGIGTSGQVLTVSGGLPVWATPATAPVTSVFTRTGAITAQSGDYTAAQVTNAVDQTASYANPAWITSLAWSKITGAPSLAPGGSNTQIQFNSSGAFGGSSYLTWDNTNHFLALGGTPPTNATFVITAVTAAGPLMMKQPIATASCAVNCWNDQAGGGYTAEFGMTGSAWASGGLSPNQGYINMGTSCAAFSIAAGAAPKVTVTYAGNVGIGTTSPGALLTIQRSGADVGLQWNNGSIYRSWYIPNGTTDFRLYDSSVASDVITVSSGGNVGIGTTSPAYSLDVRRAVLIANTDWVNGVAGSGVVITPGATSGSTYTSLQACISGGTNIASLSLNPNGGNVGIGTTNPGYSLTLASDSAAKPGTSTWTIASDARVKRNIKDLYGGLDVISRLRPVDAEYNGMAGTPPGGRAVGFLAHEVASVLPQCVTSRPETGIQDLNMHEILIHLILAVQQLSKKGN